MPNVTRLWAISSCHELSKNEAFPLASLPTSSSSILIPVRGSTACGASGTGSTVRCAIGSGGIAATVAVRIRIAIAAIAAPIRDGEFVTVILSASLCYL